MSRRRTVLQTVSLVAAGALLAACATDDDGGDGDVNVEEAFSGQRMTWVVAYEAGDSQDIAARIIAEYFSDELPGHPDIEVQNVPGGGGLSALNFVHEAKPDGLTVLFAGGSPPVEQLLQPYQPDEAFVDFDITDFEWIGGTGAESQSIWTNTDSGYETVDDIINSDESVKAAATRPGSNTFTYLALLKEVTGAPIDIVTGYESGSDSGLALFRNEVQLQAGTYATLVTNHDSSPDDVLRPVVAIGADPDPASVKDIFGIDDLPNLTDLTDDPDQEALIDTATQPVAWGRLVAVPPGTPDGVLEAMRDAFVKVAEDPDFLDELADNGLDYTMIGGDEVTDLIDEFLATPEDMIQRYLALVQG